MAAEQRTGLSKYPDNFRADSLEPRVPGSPRHRKLRWLSGSGSIVMASCCGGKSGCTDTRSSLQIRYNVPVVGQVQDQSLGMHSGQLHLALPMTVAHGYGSLPGEPPMVVEAVYVIRDGATSSFQAFSAPGLDVGGQ